MHGTSRSPDGTQPEGGCLAQLQGDTPTPLPRGSGLSGSSEEELHSVGEHRAQAEASPSNASTNTRAVSEGEVRQAAGRGQKACTPMGIPLPPVVQRQSLQTRGLRVWREEAMARQESIHFPRYMLPPPPPSGLPYPFPFPSSPSPGSVLYNNLPPPPLKYENLDVRIVSVFFTTVSSILSST